MPALNIYLLGNVSVRVGTSNSLHFPTRRSKSLFAFLVAHRQRLFRRAALAGQFWSERDEERATHSLNTELWRLRTMLKNSGLEPARFFYSDQDSVGFRSDSDHWVDAWEFLALTETVTNKKATEPPPELMSALLRAVALYQGDLADGLFDDWCLIQREAYRARLFAALEALLLQAMKAEDWETAIEHGRRLLELDPLQEHIHRSLMCCHFSRGNRPAALKQFAICAQLLRDELQVEPMEETSRICKAIKSGAEHPERLLKQRSHRPEILLPSAHSAIEQIDQALVTLTAIQTWLQRTARQLRG